MGASYDNNTGVSQLWHDGKMVKSRNIGQIELSTQYPIRVGAREGDDRYFKGKVACIQIYGKSLTEQQIGELRRCPKDGNSFFHQFNFASTRLFRQLFVLLHKMRSKAKS